MNKILIIILLFTVSTFAQSPFLFLFDELASTPAPSGNNIFVFTEGNALSQEDMETALGISLTNFSTSGDTVYFDNVDYAVPEEAFNEGDLVYLKTSADTIYPYGLGENYSLAKIITPRCKYYGDFAFYYDLAVDSIYAPNLIYWGENMFSDEGLFPSAVGHIVLDSLTHLVIGSFWGATGLITVSLKSLETVPVQTFSGCIALEYIDLRSCTDLGGTTGDDFVFNNISGQTITLIVPASLMTCNEGEPDGDIFSLQDANTVTIINP